MAPSRSACSTRSASSLREMRRDNRKPNATLLKMDIGNGVGFWNTMPTRRRSDATSIVGARMSSPSSSTAPVARWPG